MEKQFPNDLRHNRMIEGYFKTNKNSIDIKNILWVSFGSILYLSLAALLIGFKQDQVFLIVLFNALYYLSTPTRKFILAFSIFIAFWVIYDSMKIFPNYKFNSVNLENLYSLEKKVFGINVNGKEQTLNEYFNAHKHTVLDFLSGLFYLCWVPVPLIFAFYLFRKNPTQFLQFSFSFLLVNIIGFILYYVFPAAPPWYVEKYGFQFIPNIAGNAAGLLQFDKMTGLNIFTNMYQKNSNVFAAFPSLHASYPVIVLFFGIKNKMGWVNILFGIIVLGIWFGAVYSNHHYVIDILAGLTCAIVGLLLFDKVFMKANWFTRFLSAYEQKIKFG